QTSGSGISNLLAVATPFTGSGNLYCQWELYPGSGNALCILFPTTINGVEVGFNYVSATVSVPFGLERTLMYLKR
nr:hypothetical protein [Tanacetum cinerariifolium]